MAIREVKEMGTAVGVLGGWSLAGIIIAAVVVIVIGGELPGQ